MSELNLVTRTYRLLPVPAQHAVVSAYGVYWRWLRRGGAYQRFVDEFVERERSSAEMWDDWQRERLRLHLRQAANHVPYYRETWTSAQYRAACEGVLAELPLLDKDPVRQAPQRFVRTNLRQPTFTFHTSGSSGTPIASVTTAEEMRRSHAIRQARSARWAGVSFEQPRATFSGRLVEPRIDATGPYYRYNYAEHQTYLSAFHLGADTARRYVDALWQRRPTWLTGYAVSFYLLARHMLDQGLRAPPLAAVITTSEALTPAMRATMREAYGCGIFQEYGTVEQAVFACECEHGVLHLSPDAGIVEILRPDGTPCAPGETGEVVTTSFLRSAQPLIRYRVGDMATLSGNPCQCGRAMPVIEAVAGRVEDVLVGEDGRQMVRFHGVFVGLSAVVQAQVIQEAPRAIRVKVVAPDGLDAETEQEIQDRVRQRLGSSMSVVVERVDSIARTAAGKFKAVLNHCREPAGTAALGSRA